jgi:acyl carrier protein phosphodiesterase
MIRGNWFVGYSEIDGINQALSGMASRTPYESRMEDATKELREHYEKFQQEFLRFFPQLKAFRDDWMKAHNSPAEPLAN